MMRMATLLVVLVLAVGCVVASGVSALDISRNLADDTLPAQEVASGVHLESTTNAPLVVRTLDDAIRAAITGQRGIRGGQLFGIDLLAFVNSSGSCEEDVHLTGHCHVVTDVRRVHGVVELTVVITLVDVHGVGALTGARYIATGAVRKEVVTQALPSSVQVEADFDFMPLGACRLPRRMTKTLTVPIVLEFDAAGALSALGIPDNGIFD